MALHKQNIVVVDDDEGMNQAIQRLLSAAGFQVVTFASAEALLAADGAKEAGSLVLDIHLPGLSGFELHRRLAQSGAAPPVIFVTAYDDPDTQTQATMAGAVAYLTKPFPGRLLTNTVLRAIGEQSQESGGGQVKGEMERDAKAVISKPSRSVTESNENQV